MTADPGREGKAARRGVPLIDGIEKVTGARAIPRISTTVMHWSVGFCEVR